MEDQYELDVQVTIRKAHNYAESLSANYRSTIAAQDFMAAIKVLAEFEALTQRLKGSQ